jgi:geranylgeranyl diphosphate synthase type II
VLESYLADTVRLVEARLEASLSRVTERVTPRLVEAMRYSLLAGGKRLRPVLVHAAAAALGRKPGDAEQDFASALEMVHTYSLIHDDLPAMDDDDLRRGRPTSHKVFGEALAILAGDALLTDAFTLLAGSSSSEEREHRLRLVAELARSAGARGMVGGQVDDVAGQAKTREELQHVHARKTGALIRAACRGPALSPDVVEAQLSALTRYGEQLGVAFQITDDLLDAQGDAARMGKRVGKDADKGRVSYPQLLGIDGARRAANEAVESATASLRDLPGDVEPLSALAIYTLRRER